MLHNLSRPNFKETGGLTNNELDMFNLITYDILQDDSYSKFHFELTNAFHLLQAVFMWRVVIRLSKGQFWVKSNLDYEQNTVLNPIPKSRNYQQLATNLLFLYNQFQELENYHPSHLDDIRRGINCIFEIIDSAIIQQST